MSMKGWNSTGNRLLEEGFLHREMDPPAVGPNTRGRLARALSVPTHRAMELRDEWGTDLLPFGVLLQADCGFEWELV